MMKIKWKKHILRFNRPAATSRSVLLDNIVYYIFLDNNNLVGIGECNALKGLSIDDRPDFEDKLAYFVSHFEKTQEIDFALLADWPAIKFGFETALLDLKMGGSKILYKSDFTEGLKSIPINGLLWMGSKDYMLEQLSEKLDQGFSCIKMKIGAIDFNDEISILKEIRRQFDQSRIEIRVDANGAFSADSAQEKLQALSEYDIHSIEQPIMPGQITEMHKLAKHSPIAIALDEELIRVRNRKERIELLSRIKPQYIILKPSLLGGFADTDEWIEIAESMNIKWWLTSALESNIGLNAIAQYAASKKNEMPQGLGTGSLYSNNVDSPLEITNGSLSFNITQTWGIL